MAFQQLWDTQRPGGAWDWLDFGLEPFETVDAAYFGATLAALAIGTVPTFETNPENIAASAIKRLRGFLQRQYPLQSLFNRTWTLLASTRFGGLLTSSQREALVSEILSRQQNDGGWSLETLGTWRWSKLEGPFQAPGALDASLLERSDGYATGLIIYTLRKAGLSIDHPVASRGLSWLRGNQQTVRVKQQPHRAWRAYSLNFDREHGREKGEPVRRLFMSDIATDFAVLALLGSD